MEDGTVKDHVRSSTKAKDIRHGEMLKKKLNNLADCLKTLFWRRRRP
jgi:hypothetical protein